LGGGWRPEDSFRAEAGKGSYRPPFEPPGDGQEGGRRSADEREWKRTTQALRERE